MRQLNGTMLAAALSLAAGRIAQANSLDQVCERVKNLTRDLKSYTARYKLQSRAELGQGATQTNIHEGVAEWMRKGDKTLERLDCTVSSITTMPGMEPQKIQMKEAKWCDGEATHQMWNDDPAQAGRSLAEPFLPPHPPFSMGEICPTPQSRLIADAKFDNAECWVVEYAPTEPMPIFDGEVAKSHSYFRKDCGLNVNTILFNKAGREIVTAQLTGLKLNADISPDRFRSSVEVQGKEPSSAAENP